MSGMIKSVFEPLYKNSTLEIKSDTATIIIDDQRNEMKMKKDGDKYVLSGDYSTRMEEMFGGADSGVKIQMYLLKTDKGYDYVLEETIMGVSVIVKLHYVK